MSVRNRSHRMEGRSLVARGTGDRETRENSEGREGSEQTEAREGGEESEDGDGLVEEGREARECREGAHTERLAFHQLPAWLQDNEFILSNHRAALPSYRECLNSVLGIHTETGNIWSHLLGCLSFLLLCLTFFLLPSLPWHLPPAHRLPFLSFFLGAVLCLGLSATFHTLMCHSREVNRVYNKLDYVGISLLTVGSYLPWTHYGFYCHPTTKAAYMAAISLLCAVTILATMADRFATPLFRPLRAALFISLGCFGLVPLTHATLAWGWGQAWIQLQLGGMGLGGACYIFGAVLYGARLPERLWPGRWDLLGHSHQIFHVLVVVGALIHLKMIWEMAQYRLSSEGACSEGQSK